MNDINNLKDPNELRKVKLGEVSRVWEIWCPCGFSSYNLTKVLEHLMRSPEDDLEKHLKGCDIVLTRDDLMNLKRIDKSFEGHEQFSWMHDDRYVMHAKKINVLFSQKGADDNGTADIT